MQKIYHLLVCFVIISSLCCLVAARVRDPCQVAPSTTSMCTPTTLGIYYDPETQRCKYLGCSQKKLFATLEDCDKICNNNRHRRRRMQTHANKLNETTEQFKNEKDNN